MKQYQYHLLVSYVFVAPHMNAGLAAVMGMIYMIVGVLLVFNEE